MYRMRLTSGGNLTCARGNKRIRKITKHINTNVKELFQPAILHRKCLRPPAYHGQKDLKLKVKKGFITRPLNANNASLQQF